MFYSLRMWQVSNNEMDRGYYLGVGPFGATILGQKF